MAWIHAAVSEKPEFTDGRTDGRTPDARGMTVALLTKRSRAKNESHKVANYLENDYNLRKYLLYR